MFVMVRRENVSHATKQIFSILSGLSESQSIKL